MTSRSLGTRLAGLMKLGTNAGDDNRSPVELRDYYWMTLKLPDDPDAVRDRIQVLQETPDPSWTEVYELEQLQARGWPLEVLRAASKRRIDEGRRLGLPVIVSIEADVRQAWKDEEALRAVFLALLDSMHWLYVKRRLDRSEKARAALTLVRLTGLALVVLLALPLFRVSSTAEALRYATYFIFVPVCFGAGGALFSRLTSFQSGSGTLDFDTLKHVFVLRYIVLRMLVGIIGALIIQILVRGRFLEGSLFPQLRDVATGAGAAGGLPSVEFFKLAVWSFLGGFSERLVPNALEATEGRASARATAASGKDGPTGR